MQGEVVAEFSTLFHQPGFLKARRIQPIALVLLLALWAAPRLGAQIASGGITGTVKDTSGAGYATERRVLFTGWGTKDTHAGPSNLHWGLDGWIYGCDICQDVCPWNRFEQPTDIARFEPRPGNVNPQLTEIASLTHEDYVCRFRRSAIKRAKLSGLHRNANELLNHESRSE